MKHVVTLERVSQLRVGSLRYRRLTFRTACAACRGLARCALPAQRGGRKTMQAAQGRTGCVSGAELAPLPELGVGSFCVRLGQRPRSVTGEVRNGRGEVVGEVHGELYATGARLERLLQN